MDKEKLYANEAVTNTTTPPAWSSCGFRKVNEIQSNEQLTNAFLNPNWDNPMDQSDPFESALSSIVSSPAASNASAIPGPGPGDCFVIQELIGRLGNICNSSQNNNSTNTSCYSTPLNSPPKLNLSSIMDCSQIRGNLPFPGNHPNLAALAADPAFAERAARLSCFGNRSFGGQIGVNDSELSHRSGMLSRVSSNQSIKVVAGSQLNVLESNKSSPQDVNSGVQNKNFGKLSRASTPENAEPGDSKEESSVSEQTPGGDLALKPQNNGSNARKRKSIPRGKAKEPTSSSPSTNDSKLVAENDESNKRSKQDEGNTGSENDDKAKAKAEPNGTANNKPSNDATQKQNKDNSRPPEPPKDYIHVRARRGQATDSHSLAERVRREKISERMKFLQDLVPGCNKVTGKAVMLDEIINYVQSLQRQVEFLSMKLATVNPRVEFNVEALLSKDLFQSRGCGSGQHPLYQIDSSAPTFTFGYQPQPLHSGMANNTAENQFSMNPVNAALHRNNSNMQFPLINAYGEAPSQVPSFWEDDLQSLVQMGFNQNQPQSFHGSGSMAAAAQMKVEL